MFVPNGQHFQMPMFSSISSLPEKILKRLEASWAGTFYREIFVRIDEKVFAILYSDKASRPNTPVDAIVESISFDADSHALIVTLVERIVD